MQTKSNIQLVKEALQYKESFKECLSDLINKYMVENSTFSFNGSLKEKVNGYFVVENEYNTLDEAMGNLTPGQLVRVVENKKFQIGSVSEKLSNTSNEKIVIDLSTGSEV